jgi:hypothetical protein
VNRLSTEGGEASQESPIIKALKIRMIIIVIIVIVICITFAVSFFGFLGESQNDDCALIAPLSMIVDQIGCLSVQEIETTGPMNKSRLVLEQSTTMPDQLRSGQNLSSSPNLNPALGISGKWAIFGHHGNNIIYADANLKSDDSYNLTGILDLENNGVVTSDSVGHYALEYSRGLLFLSNSDGLLSAYIINNMRNDSFYAFNPNTGEAYNFLRTS